MRIILGIANNRTVDSGKLYTDLVVASGIKENIKLGWGRGFFEKTPSPIEFAVSLLENTDFRERNL